MATAELSNIRLPDENEVETAVHGQRALVAILTTGFETCGARQKQSSFAQQK